LCQALPPCALEAAHVRRTVGNRIVFPGLQITPYITLAALAGNAKFTSIGPRRIPDMALLSGFEVRDLQRALPHVHTPEF